MATLSTSFFFFSMIRLPSTTTLFPYTTLFRSEYGHLRVAGWVRFSGRHGGRAGVVVQSTAVASISTIISGKARRVTPRSEEHTSELQSHSDLVCRLLLEKKNTVNSIIVLS